MYTLIYTMNIHDCSLDNMFNNNLLAEKKVKEMKEEEKQCYYIMVDLDNTFRVETFENKELDYIKKWFENIGQTIDIEKANISVTESEMKEIYNIIGNDIPLEKKDCIIGDINKIKKYLSSKRDIEKLKLIYNNLENKDNKKSHSIKIKPIQKANSKLQSMTIKPSYNDKYYEYIFDIPHKNVLNENKNKKKEISGYNINEYENNSISNLGGFIKYNDENKEINKYYIIYNSKYNGSFSLCNISELELKMLNKEKLGFKIYKIISVNEENKEFISILNTLISCKVHDSEETFKKKVDTIISLYTQSEDNLKQKTEFEHIKKFINDKYDINNKIENKIKASNLLNIIEEYLESNIENFTRGRISFRNKLSKYLYDIGLKKKRFGDGFYYYGLILKNISISEKFGIDINSKNLIENIMNKRQNEISPIMRHWAR